MSPAELRLIYRDAAKQVEYPLVKQYIQEHLEPPFHDLGLRLALIAVPPHIVQMSSLQHRREAIHTYPEVDGELSGIQDQLMLGVQRLWRKRPPLQKRRGNTSADIATEVQQRGLFAS